MKKKQKQRQHESVALPEYAEPVAQLLKLGRPDDKWLDYAALGLSKADAPELKELALNEILFIEADEPEAYAPIHAWRALGQLQIEDAAPVLLEAVLLFDSDWITEDMPDALGHLGPAAIAPIKAFLADETILGPDYYLEGPRITAAHALECIAKRHRTARGDCVAALVEQLKLHADNPPEINGSLVASLIDLDASEALPIIDRAYGAGDVDPMICGDLRTVRTAFGLLPPGETPEPTFLGSKKPSWDF